ncbi:amidase [Flavilitoribacter nigricans DSM 23189 = NBRC 102662]|uniref:Amidase n=2 Tax=Flavilitoribacter TaxID=2762562 RepID=A0A2D0MZA6_FLAN2|nr:amidase [Flavilitoribacter nigricans DSM 23189 = NBRC 102662]
MLFLAFLTGGFSVQYFSAEITAEDARSSAKIMGLEFTDAEIDSLLPALEGFREDYISLRKKELPNSVSPALYFNPLPPDFVTPTEQNAVSFSDPGEVKLPADRSELAFYTVRQLAALLKSQQITSTELTKFFIERLKAYDPTLHCVITITEEKALQQAAKADAEIQAGNYRGLLHGIPYGAKDLLAAEGYKTTWGAMPYKEQQLDYDATVVQKLEEAGAVLTAKLTMGALAMGDVWYGERTRNPWDPESGSSGSSAGSASAVAAGLLPFAIGTETLGSIVSPSTVCGTTGLRPTYGRVSRHGAMALSWSMDKIGPICRSAEDCAVVFQAIAGPDGKDLSVTDYPFNYQADYPANRKLKVGYDQAAFERDYGFKEQDQASLKVLEDLGYELVPIELPEMPDIGFLLSVEAAAAFDELTRSGQDELLVRQTRNAWPNLFRRARFVPAVEYIQANRVRTQLVADMAKVFEEVDLYVHPSWASRSLRITNYTGHPCVVLPNGFQENGRPTSISFTGKLYDEGTIVGVAQAYQNATEFEDQHPALKD